MRSAFTRKIGAATGPSGPACWARGQCLYFHIVRRRSIGVLREQEVALINYTARWVASSLEHGRNIDLGSLLLQSEDPDTRAKFSFVDVYSSTLTSIYYRNRLKFEEQIHRHRDAAPPSHKKVISAKGAESRSSSRSIFRRNN